MEIEIINLKLMKKNNFEVIISPKDVLGDEMKDVLGGKVQTEAGCTKCKRVHCNCDDKGRSILETDLNPGFVAVDDVLIEID